MAISLTLRGIYPAHLSPFKEDYSLDEQELRRHIQDLVAVRGVAGLITNGHAGEVTSLTREERVRVLGIVREEVGSKLPIIAGVISEATMQAIELARDAKNHGADAILLFPPYLFARGGVADDEHPFHFIASVADSVDIPIVVFQFPPAMGLGYNTRTLLRLVEEIPSVIGFKECSMDLRRYEENVRALRTCSRRTAILSANNTMHLPCLAIDGDGIISGSGSVIADLLVALWRAVEAKDLAGAGAVNDRIFPISQVLYAAPSLNMHNRMKVALQLLGRQKWAVARPPLLPIKAEERGRIKQALIQAGLL